MNRLTQMMVFAAAVGALGQLEDPGERRGGVNDQKAIRKQRARELTRINMQKKMSKRGNA